MYEVVDAVVLAAKNLMTIPKIVPAIVMVTNMIAVRAALLERVVTVWVVEVNAERKRMGILVEEIFVGRVHRDNRQVLQLCAPLVDCLR